MKTFPTILLLILSWSLVAQIPVTDSATQGQLGVLNTSSWKNYLKNSALLTKAAATYKTISNMNKTYNEWTEAVREVNNYISQGKQIYYLVDKSVQIKELFEQCITIVGQQKYLENADKEQLFYLFTEILSRALSKISESKDISTNGLLEMSDSERLNMLNEITKEVDECYALMVYALKKFQYAISVANSDYTGNFQMNIRN